MPKKLDLTNYQFGRLRVLRPGPNQGKNTTWICQCDCGNEYIARTDSLRSGKLLSCGCLRQEKAKEQAQKNVISLIGKRFGRLTVIKQTESYRDHSAWLCECDCGNTKIINSVELKRGDTVSCGCLKSSFGEMAIEAILKEYNYIYTKEYTFPDLVSENLIPLRFDFAVFNEQNSLLFLIEYDGEQHYLEKTNNFWKTDSLEKRQQHDDLKNKYCIENNITLIRIPYWEKNNISLELILNDKYKITS